MPTATAPRRPLKIQTVGLEQYAPGGEANIKMMVIGGPGAGKTRSASFWPQPIYAAAEGGMGAVADRRSPFVEITDSVDMLEFLKRMEAECQRPKPDRRYRTIVIDTLDGYQRKVKQEWLRNNPTADSFSGYDAWGFLEDRMQVLMTRLLNLDMNVIVNVHYKDKSYTEGTGPNRVERHELMLQLQGDIKDSAFNDFDLVGWMGTYWEHDGEQRVRKRGLTFQPTPEKPFLKDRLYITPDWLEVTFTERDYTGLFERFVARLDELSESEEVEEIEPQGPDRLVKGAGVVGPQRGGPVTASKPQDMPLDQHDRKTLLSLARKAGLDVKANAKKAELVEALERYQAEQASNGQSQETPVATSKEESSEQPATTPKRESEPAEESPVQPKPEPEPSKPEPEPEPKKAEVANENVCEVEGCDRDLAGENQDYVKLSFIKFRKRMCNEHYVEAKKAQRKE